MLITPTVRLFQLTVDVLGSIRYREVLLDV